MTLPKDWPCPCDCHIPGLISMHILPCCERTGEKLENDENGEVAK